MRAELPGRTGPRFMAVTLAGLLCRTGWKFLTRLKSRAVCWVIGHDVNYGIWHVRCFRCGDHWDLGEHVRTDLNFQIDLYLVKRKIRLTITHFVAGTACLVCGQRVPFADALKHDFFVVCSKECRSKWYPL